MDLHHLLLAGLPAHSDLPPTTDIPERDSRGRPSFQHSAIVRFAPIAANRKSDVMDVCFSPRSGHRSPPEPRLLRAKSGSATSIEVSIRKTVTSLSRQSERAAPNQSGQPG